MGTLSETISSALAAAGPAVEGRFYDILAELAELNLAEEGRLAVLASALAAVAALHHGPHKGVYLEAVRTWALEVSVARGGPARRLGSGGDGAGAITDGTEILLAGLDALLETMDQAGVGVREQLATELALFARLLGQYDAEAIHLTLMAAATAAAGQGFRPGQTVDVVLAATARPIARDACLATLAPRGLA